MRNRVTYEWRLNRRDEHGDIEDINFFDHYADAANELHVRNDCGWSDIELTRVLGNDDDGILDREYAPVINGRLPERFDEGCKVNKAHHREVERWHEIWAKYEEGLQ